MTTITKEWLQQTIAEFENTRDDIPFGLDDDDAKILIVLKRALASLERERIRREHAEWSDKTFGDVGPVGPLKHLSKEALEAAADPSDPLEWADMQFLLWDAQRRMGISDEFITRAMIEKLEINKSRQWPEPKDGEPRLHIKEQLAPVVPPAIEPDYEVIKSILPTANPDEYACCIAADIWNACRAAMLQGAEPVSNHDELALYYLQGQKDGLEWAAQLAEANHPLTGDWLYDDRWSWLKLSEKVQICPGSPEALQ
ncbi:Eaa protein [Salmonella enterica subsp. enterica]|uniref:Eaa protein n=1 Tax=Salmonella enterica I TaxID=59201 RepID=A0A3S4F1T1_SALET|nr:Eaa protein [Salmonella enterica subsp. enterica]